MSDKKISQLPASTTPLAGTEVLPIVQGGVTDQVSVANLTAGRAVSATQYTSTIATGTAPLVVASTTEVANLKAATATLADSATSANAVKSNATTGLLQVTGPTAGTTRVMTTPDANFTVARTDAGQTFTGTQTFSSAISGSVTGTAAGLSATLAIASGGTNQTAFTSPASSIAGLVWFDGTSFQNDTTTSHVGYNPSTNTFYANTPTFAGNTTLSTGNLVIGTSGKGIDFSAVTHAGSTSKLLADYEEGTWTPTLTALTAGDLSTTYQYRTGTYRKIGKLVYVDFAIVTTAWTWTTASGDVLVTGLPFAVTNTQNQGAGAISTWQGVTLPAGYTAITTYGSSNTTHMYLTIGGSAKASTTLQISAMPSGTQQYLYGSVCYPVA